MPATLSQTFVQASAQLDAACAWLGELGINVSPTRIGRYKALFSSAARHQLAGTLDAFRKECSDTAFLNLAHEAAEIIRIYEGLGGMEVPGLKQRLLQTVKGREFYAEDREDRSGRDFSFELVTASKFARAGWEVDFGHLADLRSKLMEHQLFVECKRLKSPSKVEARIKGGLRQLQSRYNKSDVPARARGLLVLSIGKLFNAGLAHIDADDMTDLERKTVIVNSEFIELNRRLWQTNPDPRTLGVVVVFDAIVQVTSARMLYTCHDVALNHCMPMDSPNHPLLHLLARDVFGVRTTGAA